MLNALALVWRNPRIVLVATAFAGLVALYWLARRSGADAARLAAEADRLQRALESEREVANARKRMREARDEARRGDTRDWLRRGGVRGDDDR